MIEIAAMVMGVCLTLCTLGLELTSPLNEVCDFTQVIVSKGIGLTVNEAGKN